MPDTPTPPARVWPIFGGIVAGAAVVAMSVVMLPQYLDASGEPQHTADSAPAAPADTTEPTFTAQPRYVETAKVTQFSVELDDGRTIPCVWVTKVATSTGLDCDWSAAAATSDPDAP